jgi:sulfotransferase family protein
VSDGRRNIVWIASYPKSGNTWVRFLLCNLLHGRQDSALSLNTLAPDIHEVGAQILHHPGGLAKTHFAFSPRMPCAERTAAAIYVVRDPADVIASNYHYQRRSGASSEDSPGAFDRYFDRFVEERGDPRWRELGMGTWEQNACSWLDPNHPFPVLCLRYEALLADPHSAARSLARLLRPGSSDEEIGLAVESSSFARLREVEEADIRHRRVGIFYKPYLQDSIDSGNRFMRSGTAGEGARRLNAEQRARLQAAFPALLRRLGYFSRDPIQADSGHP